MIGRGMILAGVLACLAMTPASVSGAGSCCFGAPPKSLRQEAADANTVVLHGFFANRRTTQDGEVLVDLVVLNVVKSTAAYKEARVHVLERDVEIPRAGPNGPQHFLVFLE